MRCFHHFSSCQIVKLFYKHGNNRRSILYQDSRFPKEPKKRSAAGNKMKVEFEIIIKLSTEFFMKTVIIRSI